MLFTINQPEPKYTEAQQQFLDWVQQISQNSYKNQDREFKKLRYQHLLETQEDFKKIVEIFKLNDITEALSSYDILCHNGFLKIYLELGGQFIEPESILIGSLDMKATFLQHFGPVLGEMKSTEMWYYLASVSLKNDLGTTKGGCELRNVICIKSARFIHNHEPAAIHGDFAITLNGKEYGVEHKGNQCRFGGQEVAWDIKEFERLGNVWRKLMGLNPRVHPFKNLADWKDLNQILWEQNRWIAAWNDLIHALFPTADWRWVQEQSKCLYQIIENIPKWYLKETKIAQRAGKRNGQAYKKGDVLSTYHKTDPTLVYAKIPMGFIGALQGYFYQTHERFDYIWFELDGKYYPMKWVDGDNVLEPKQIYDQMFGKLLACAGFNGGSREKSVQFQILPQKR